MKNEGLSNQYVYDDEEENLGKTSPFEQSESNWFWSTSEDSRCSSEDSIPHSISNGFGSSNDENNKHDSSNHSPSSISRAPTSLLSCRFSRRKSAFSFEQWSVLLDERHSPCRDQCRTKSDRQTLFNDTECLLLFRVLIVLLCFASFFVCSMCFVFVFFSDTIPLLMDREKAICSWLTSEKE